MFRCTVCDLYKDTKCEKQIVPDKTDWCGEFQPIRTMMWDLNQEIKDAERKGVRPTLYPKIKFADTNNIPEQLIHVQSELEEFKTAWVIYCFHKFESGDQKKMEKALHEMILEAHDMIQTAVTNMDVLERLYPGQAWSAREEMIQKNEVRSYYSEVKK